MTGGALRILIADDHPLIRAGFKDVLLHELKTAFLGEAQDSEEALRLIRKERWDLLAGTWCGARDIAYGALSRLGLDSRNDLDIGHILGEASANVDWNQGSTGLLDILAFLVLDEALPASPSLVRATSGFEEKRRMLMNAWWTIRDEERRGFLKDAFDLKEYDLRPQELILPVKDALCAAVEGQRVE